MLRKFLENPPYFRFFRRGELIPGEGEESPMRDLCNASKQSGEDASRFRFLAEEVK
jgi:hypothetical protein